MHSGIRIGSPRQPTAKNLMISVGAAGLEPTTPGFGGHRRRSVAIRFDAEHVKFIGFLALSLTHRAESNRLITHLGIRRVYGFWVVSGLTTRCAVPRCRGAFSVSVRRTPSLTGAMAGVTWSGDVGRASRGMRA